MKTSLKRLFRFFRHSSGLSETNECRNTLALWCELRKENKVMSWLKLSYNLTLFTTWCSETRYLGITSVCCTKISPCTQEWRARENTSMERCSSKRADKGLKGWSIEVTNVDVTGAGYLWRGNALTPGTEKMKSSSDGVLRAEVTSLIKTRSDLKSLWCFPAVQQCSPWKEESRQSGKGLVTDKVRLKKSYCHQRRCQMIREGKKEKRMPKNMNASSSYLDPKGSQCPRLRETGRGSIQPSLPA